MKTESGGIFSFGNIAPAANTQFPRDWIVEMAEHWLDESEKRIQLEGRAQPVGFFYSGTGRVGLFPKSLGIGTGRDGYWEKFKGKKHLHIYIDLPFSS